MYIEGLLVPLLSVRANKELVKDVLTCRPLESLVYKSHHPDNTDNPDTISVSSEDEAEGMEDILRMSRRLNKPPPAEPSPPEPAAPEEEGMIKVPKKDLKRAQGILKNILAGKKVCASTGVTWEDVPFKVPKVQVGDTSCELCHQFQKYPLTASPYEDTYWGHWMVLQLVWQSAGMQSMHDLHMKGCGQEKGHWCQECNRGYTTKQALVAHIKAKHGPPPTVEQLTCPTCSKVFKLIKTMCEHMASHKGPFYCRVEGCSAGPFSLPKCLNRHMKEKHSFSARKE